MKRYIYSFWGVIVALTFQSCNLNVEPVSSVSSNTVFQNVENAEKILNGTWANLWEDFYTYQNPGWTSLLLTSDAMGNDVVLQPGKYGYYKHYSFTNINSTNSTTGLAVWSLGYKTIDNANQVIAKIDNAVGENKDKARVKAQAQALRGYIYLNLASFFSQSYATNPDALSVPVYTDPTVLSTAGKPKSRLKDVYKQVETDLQAAYQNIGDYDRADKKYKIDKHVIAGLLARLYLQLGEWEKAQQFADEAQSTYSWMAKADYLKGFNDNNNAEWIWGHGQTTEQSNASYSFHFKDVSSSSAYYYSFMADPFFKDLFDENDIRTQLFEWDTRRYLGGLMYKKFLFRSNSTADIVLMRKAEMVLIEAEAYAEQGQLTAAIVKLNELRQQRGADTPNLSGLSKTKLVEQILIERRKELFGEGFALSDIIRRQKAVERKEVPVGTLLRINGQPIVVNNNNVTIKGHSVTKFPDGTSFSPNSPFYLFIIPSKEVISNSNL